MTREERQKEFDRKRLAAMDRVRRDERLTASFRAVGGELFALVNFETGDAFPQEVYLVEKLGLSPRTVKMAIKALSEAGYFTVVKRGRCNRYQPNFEAGEKVQNLHLSDGQQVQNLHLSDDDRCKKRPEQVQKTSGKRCKICTPTSLKTSLRTSGATSSAGGAPETGAACELFMGIAGTSLRERLGEDLFAAWFAKLRFVREGDGLLVLSAPTKFIASYVKSNFAGHILQAAGRADLGRLEIEIGPASLGQHRAVRAENPDARWLLEIGVGLIGEQRAIGRDAADRELVGYLKRCGNDTAGLRAILEGAVEQQLFGDAFDRVVNQRTLELLRADQGAFRFKPVGLRRNAS